jgi:hypothetical protein
VAAERHVSYLGFGTRRSPVSMYVPSLVVPTTERAWSDRKSRDHGTKLTIAEICPDVFGKKKYRRKVGRCSVDKIGERTCSAMVRNLWHIQKRVDMSGNDARDLRNVVDRSYWLQHTSHRTIGPSRCPSRPAGGPNRKGGMNADNHHSRQTESESRART